jgi:hypothetical protein
MKSPKFLQSLLSLVLLFISTSEILAQGPPGLDVPIDQHLHYLIVAGLAFGLYWAYKQIKSQRSRD